MTVAFTVVTRPSESVAVTLNVYRPACEGVPATVAVVVLVAAASGGVKTTPDGSVPPASAHVNVPVPPAAVSVALNSTPTSDFGGVPNGCVTTTGCLTEIV